MQEGGGSMTTPLWDELNVLADELAGSLPKSKLMILRGAAIQMENWFEANQEAFEQIDMLRTDRDAYRAALLFMASQLEAFSKKANEAAFAFSPDAFARDFTSHVNLMSAFGVEPYAKNKRSKSAKEEA